jgi:hypothetical protein
VFNPLVGAGLAVRAGLAKAPQPDAAGLWQVKEIGTGFLLIERALIERMIARRPERKYFAEGTGRLEHDLFPCGVWNGRYLSEDYGFCQTVTEMGVPVVGDTRVILQHVGKAVYPLESQRESRTEALSETLREARKRLAAAKAW